MPFHLLKKRKHNHQKRLVDEQLKATMQDIYQKYQLLKELEEAAYDVSDELYMARKIEGAKYLCFLKEARKRHISADMSAPKKAKAFRIKKRGYQKDHLFTQD